MEGAEGGRWGLVAIPSPRPAGLCGEQPPPRPRCGQGEPGRGSSPDLWDLQRWSREPGQAGAGLVQEEEEEEVTVAVALYPGVGMAFLLVHQGLSGTESLARGPPLRARDGEH